MRSQNNKASFIVSVLCLVGLFITFVLLGSDQRVRSNRACFPVFWVGNLTASTVSLFDYDKANRLVRNNFRPTFSSCVSSANELFYGTSAKSKIQKFSKNLFRE
jgi:hypothetical protein